MDLTNLNPMQRLAAETLQGPLLIVAGAGSGKTRSLTYRVANLIAGGIDPSAIMALTFTNKAAKEMRTRITTLTGGHSLSAWIGTFHSICVRILRRDIEKIGYNRAFVIYDEDDQLKVLKEVYAHLDLDDKHFPQKEMRRVISDAKNRLMDADEWFSHSAKDYRSQRIVDVFREYNKRLKRANALDFEDLIMHALNLLVDHPPVLEHYRRRFEYVHVDEYQDTNFAQYSFVRLLTEKSRNLCVVGDDDQSIYGWRGADIRNILEFKKDFPDARVIKLEQNYRSTATILNAANQVISNNAGRMEKNLWTDGEAGEKIKLCRALDEREEAAWVCDRVRRLHQRKLPYSGIAILYRTHAQSRVLEEMMMRAGIPYRVYGGTRFYDRKEIRDTIAYLRLIINPVDDVSLRRIINVPKRSIGEATVSALEKQSTLRETPLYDTLKDLPEELSSRPRKCVTEFASMMEGLVQARQTMPLTDFVQRLLDDTGMLAQFDNPNDEEQLSRKENLLEFLGAVREFEEQSEDVSLEAFLENVALVSDLDLQEDKPQFVTMMTLHSAKGLEYDAVFMTGMEEGLFPGLRSLQDPQRFEEERRLCYVGMTRAKKHLFLSLTRHRTLYNQMSQNPPSPFVSEIPARLISDEWGKTMRKHFGEMDDVFPLARRTPARPVKASLGVPAMGQSLLSIPGVRKGIGSSPAKGPAAGMVFSIGDRVLHKRFGEGMVTEISGEGRDSRIKISFTAYGEKQFSANLAPIVKLE